METAKISSGQTVEFVDGVSQVRASPAPDVKSHYRLVAAHSSSGALVNVMCDDYDGLSSFLKQLEKLGYVMCNMTHINT